MHYVYVQQHAFEASLSASSSSSLIFPSSMLSSTTSSTPSSCELVLLTWLVLLIGPWLTEDQLDREVCRGTKERSTRLASSEADTWNLPTFYRGNYLLRHYILLYSPLLILSQLPCSNSSWVGYENFFPVCWYFPHPRIRQRNTLCVCFRRDTFLQIKEKLMMSQILNFGSSCRYWSYLLWDLVWEIIWLEVKDM